MVISYTLELFDDNNDYASGPVAAWSDIDDTTSSCQDCCPCKPYMANNEGIIRVSRPLSEVDSTGSNNESNAEEWTSFSEESRRSMLRQLGPPPRLTRQHATWIVPDDEEAHHNHNHNHH